jgi:hypothetical protein
MLRTAGSILLTLVILVNALSFAAYGSNSSVNSIFRTSWIFRCGGAAWLMHTEPPC